MNPSCYLIADPGGLNNIESTFFVLHQPGLCSVKRPETFV